MRVSLYCDGRLLQAALEAPADWAAFRQSVLLLYFDALKLPPGACAWFGALVLPLEPIVEPVLPAPLPVIPLLPVVPVPVVLLVEPPIELPEEPLGDVVLGDVAPGELVPGLAPVLVPVLAPVPVPALPPVPPAPPD